MTNLSKLAIPEKVALVRKAWELFTTTTTAKDAEAVSLINAGFANGVMERNDDMFDSNRLGNLAVWVYGLLQDAAEGRRRDATESAEGAIRAMADMIDRTHPTIAQQIRNI